MNYEKYALKYGFHSIRTANFLRWLKPNWFIRPMFRYIRDNYNYPLTGVEIGVSKGYNAEVVLRTLPIKVLHLIDPNYECRDIIFKYYNAYFYWGKSSEEAESIPDCLDFVYIDGDHSQEAVSQDIENYYPKVRKGGVIGGHDINLGSVFKAVKEKFPVFFMQVNDWWVVKK
jgi:hypothetical protein